MGDGSKPRQYSCGLEAALEVVGGKWKVLILWTLGSGPLRFGELRRQIPGISEKMLIQNLKEMEADGIVTRTDHKEVPPRVDYAMTAFGHSLCAALAPLCAWGQEHIERIDACRRAHEAREEAKRERVDA
ncbi:transcriptional regulator, HxlR family [Tistlia consotensis]|uniref:Transcriptional regulator, HxlR family n=1 Tax=Tistlia consotensis USBA 355 TaxID=560819 RepID=A0A1Y6CHJ9_9PROT|nr:helix-turn-helix domain-containing protein [Tistlia consotensis]SMF55423.1 transcriptional regulator, HxlR family [Tistlia consotensis USBA 355]SNR88398.1 transcriptional regulator, HxlR family [Tistlia consotensis]